MKPIRGYEGRYSVTSDGRVWSHVSNRFLCPQPHSLGYRTIMLSKGSRGLLKCHYIHRIVAQAFVENPDAYTEVNHKDGVKENNDASNLEWCTHLHNMRHAERTRLRKAAKGEQHGMSKLDGRSVNRIRALRVEGQTLREIAQRFSVSMSLVSHIARNNIWKHV